MGPDCLLRAVLILTCIHHIHSQYFDLFQAFQPFVQPQPSQPLNFFNDFTTRRPTPKQKQKIIDHKHDENIRKLDKITITEDIQDSNVRKVASAQQAEKNKQSSRRRTTNAPLANFFTTQRPSRKTTKTQAIATNNHKNLNREDRKEIPTIVFLDDDSKIKSDNSRTTKSPVSRQSSDNSRDRNRPASRPSGRTQSQALTATNYESSWYDGGRNSVNYYTTKPPYYETTKTYNYLQNDNRNKNTNYYTTHNPLLNRPGVKPAVVHGPPITNRPVTQRPNFDQKPQGIHVDDDLNVAPEVISGPDEDFMSVVEKKRYIDIAERMCDKYKNLNTKQVEAIPLLPSPQPVRVNVSSCLPTTIPLVVGGKVVSIQEFPHMALLGWRKIKNTGYSWKCGGSLLSNQYILTAAHCAYQDRDDNVIAGPPRIVQLGSSYLNDPKAIFMKISSVTRHPKYKLPKAYYDLAIVKMAGTITFSDMIKPACLGTPPAAHNPIIATGWGRTEFGGTQSKELRSVSIPVWDISECHNALGVSMKIPYGPSSDSQICAGERRGGRDTCQGDSGGPAQIQDGCIWRVVAVTSIGRLCGAADTPAIYATVQRAFISAVVFAKETTQNNRFPNNENSNRNNNNRDSNQAANNQGSIYSDWNNKKATTTTARTTYQQTNNFNRNNGMSEWNNKPSSTAAATTSSYGQNANYNWNNNRDGSNYNQNNQGSYQTNNLKSQNNQPNRNDNSHNYNSQTTENYSDSNSRRDNNYYNPPSQTDNTGQYYNNYRDRYNRQQGYVPDGGRETYYNSDGNVWWT